jgi:hypothetical protein
MFGAIKRFIAYCESEYEKENTAFARVGIPSCMFCHNRVKDYTIVRQFTYSVDRLSRGRVKVLLRCNHCNMQAICMRWGDSSKWSWYESN